MNPSMTSPVFHALQAELIAQPSQLRNRITEAYRRDEAEAVQWLLSNLQDIPAAKNKIHELARNLVTNVREQRTRASGVDALMHEFSL